MRVDFYHLTAAPLERVLPRIVERVVGDGGRLVIVSADPAQRVAIDKLLWTYAPESFLPHALAGDDDDATQPVLISGVAAPLNEARNVALADGQWREEALGFDRAFHFFDEGRIVEARTAWKTLANREDVERRYWKQDESGKWEQAA